MFGYWARKRQPANRWTRYLGSVLRHVAHCSHEVIAHGCLGAPRIASRERLVDHAVPLVARAAHAAPGW